MLHSSPALCRKETLQFVIFSSLKYFYSGWSHTGSCFFTNISTFVSTDRLLNLQSHFSLFPECPLGLCCGLSSWCPTFFHFFFISFFHPLVALLRCTVGECRSGRQTDTGRVLWTTFPLTWLSFSLLLFLLSWPASLLLLISNQPEVHERILLMLYIFSVHRVTL